MPFLTYFSAARFTFDGVRMLDEGYMKAIASPLPCTKLLTRPP